MPPLARAEYTHIVRERERVVRCGRPDVCGAECIRGKVVREGRGLRPVIRRSRQQVYQRAIVAEPAGSRSPRTPVRCGEGGRHGAGNCWRDGAQAADTVTAPRVLLVQWPPAPSSPIRQLQRTARLGVRDMRRRHGAIVLGVGGRGEEVELALVEAPPTVARVPPCVRAATPEGVPDVSDGECHERVEGHDERGRAQDRRDGGLPDGVRERRGRRGVHRHGEGGISSREQVLW